MKFEKTRFERAFKSQRVMSIRVSNNKTNEVEEIDSLVSTNHDYETDHFYFNTEELVHEVMNPNALKLLSKIRSGNFDEYGVYKTELDRLLEHGIIELKEFGYYFDYDLIKFDYHVYI